MKKLTIKGKKILYPFIGVLFKNCVKRINGKNAWGNFEIRIK